LTLLLPQVVVLAQKELEHAGTAGGNGGSGGGSTGNLVLQAEASGNTPSTPRHLKEIMAVDQVILLLRMEQEVVAVLLLVGGNGTSSVAGDGGNGTKHLLFLVLAHLLLVAAVAALLVTHQMAGQVVEVGGFGGNRRSTYCYIWNR
jgi:hypothetical protein